MTDIEKIKLPPGALIDAAQSRAKQIAEEEVKRFAKIADRIIKILIDEKITTQEVARVTSAVNGLLNKRIDEAEIE